MAYHSADPDEDGRCACAAFFLAWAIGQALIDDYDMIGVPDEVL